jgi:hypothetical protein
MKMRLRVMRLWSGIGIGAVIQLCYVCRKKRPHPTFCGTTLPQGGRWVKGASLRQMHYSLRLALENFKVVPVLSTKLTCVARPLKHAAVYRSRYLFSRFRTTVPIIGG